MITFLLARNIVIIKRWDSGRSDKKEEEVWYNIYKKMYYICEQDIQFVYLILTVSIVEIIKNKTLFFKSPYKFQMNVQSN